MADIPVIPGYKIQKKLGEGGMSTVYLGIQEKLKRKVAIKILDPSLLKNKIVEIRFLQEAETAANLRHSNIISVFDIGREGFFNYIVMEYLEETLKDHLLGFPDFRIKPGPALAALKQIAEALDYAHARGIIHRDIKTENIMFREDRTPVLTDFGIARALDSNKDMTRTGMSLGTPYYMSPEQCTAHPLDGRSDIYSLGVVLFEILTGEKPYDADSPMAVALKHVQEPVPQLPEELKLYQPLIDKMMAKNKENRPATCKELIQLMDSIHQQALQAQQSPKTDIPKKEIPPPPLETELELDDKPTPIPKEKPVPKPKPASRSILKPKPAPPPILEEKPAPEPIFKPKTGTTAKPTLAHKPEPEPVPAPPPSTVTTTVPVPPKKPKTSTETVVIPVPILKTKPSTATIQMPLPISKPKPGTGSEPIAKPDAEPIAKPGTERDIFTGMDVEPEPITRPMPREYIITTPISVPAVSLPPTPSPTPKSKKTPSILKQYPLKKIIEIAALVVLLGVIFVIFYNLGSGTGEGKAGKGVKAGSASGAVNPSATQSLAGRFSREFLRQGTQYKSDYSLALSFYEKKEFENALESVNRLKEIEPVPEVLELETKITLAMTEGKENDFNAYIAEAEECLKKGNYKKARENILLAKAIKTTPEVEALEKRIDTANTVFQNQIKEKSAKAKALQQQDDQAFEQAAGKNSIEAYRQYLGEFPTGKHVDDAIGRINKLEEAQRLQEEAARKAVIPSVKLRRAYKTLNYGDVEAMIKKYNFFDDSFNKNGAFKNKYEKQSLGTGDTVAVDSAANLMWYAGNPAREMGFKKAQKWLSNLNAEKYAGFSDWRFPTLEEAASLLRKNKNAQGLHTDAVFTDNLNSIWTADHLRQQTYWVVRFIQGIVYADSDRTSQQIRAVRSMK